MNDTIQMIGLDLIEAHPANRRVGGFNQAKLEELAESIKAVGVQQPAIVRRIDGRIGVEYQLVAGERRWRASRIAGMGALPCIVRELDDVTAIEIQQIENLQRDDVHPLDEADGYSQLIETAGYTIETLAQKVGKSTSYIYQRLKLSSLVDEARQLFVDNKIAAGHAILIARQGPEQQKLIIEEGLFEMWGSDDEMDVASVRAVDQYIHEHIMLDLSYATWKQDDAGLLPDAGSCKECPRRTGFNPELFADVCKNENVKGKGKKDYCMDRACNEKKRAAVVERKRAELVGQDVLEVLDGYSSKEIPKGVLRKYEWQECKKSDPGAKKVLVVDGNTPGRVTFGRALNNGQSRTCSTSPEEKAKQKEKEKKELEKRKAAEELRIAKYNAVNEAAMKWRLNNNDPFPLEALRVCLLKIWNNFGYDDGDVIAKLEGWGTNKNTNPLPEGEKRIKLMTETQLYRLLLILVMCDEIEFNQYCMPHTEMIDALMKVYGVSVEKPGGKTKGPKEKDLKAKAKAKAKIKKK